jgi:hypothetical protein
LEHHEGIVRNNDFLEDEQAFEDLQNHLFESLIPLVETGSEELCRQFEVFYKTTFSEFKAEFMMNVEEGEKV